MDIAGTTIAVIGLGYVGLPLAVAFGRQFPVIGFDIDEGRILELASGKDRTHEVEPQDLASAISLRLTSSAEVLAEANVYIVTAPTPIDQHRQPDFRPLLTATQTVGRFLKTGDIVIFESTVYPGATEDVCVPVLEDCSGLRMNEDFFVGYSPERINPGDKIHRLETIVKITSASSPEAAEFVDALYGTIITAGTHIAESIRVAEAAKVIENTQRDVNIALINELALLFGKMGLDTEDVLRAARSKWNFLDFRPGLVGGHCIGVDPYYLTYKAQEIGYHPEIILAGRRLNDSMASRVTVEFLKAMMKLRISVPGSRVLILGVTFKENTPDLRNSRVPEIYTELHELGILVDVFDPWADPLKALSEYGIHLVESPDTGEYHGILLAVAHREIVSMGSETIHSFGRPEGHTLYDLKSVFPKSDSDIRL